MKKILLALMLMCSISAVAQDVIVKTDGSTIVCRVLHLTSTDVVYNNWSELNGPNRSIARTEVKTINYEGMANDHESRNQYQPLDNHEEKLSIIKSFGAFYLASFDLPGKGIYGVKVDVWNLNRHLGASLSYGMNIGLVPSEVSVFDLRVGPTAIFEIKEPLYLVCPLRFVGDWGTKKDKNNKDKTAFAWGVDIAPGLMVCSNRWSFQAAFCVNWKKGVDKLGTSFMVEIGYDI